MRVSVHGQASAAKVLRGYLEAAGFHVTDFSPSYTVLIEEGTGPNIVLDGVNCPFKDAVQDAIAELTDTRIEYHRAGGVQSDRKIRVVTPPKETDSETVERGLLRALLVVSGHHMARGSFKRFLTFWR